MFRLKLVFYPIVLLGLMACVEKKISKEEKQTLITASDVLDVYEFNIKNTRSKEVFSKLNILGAIEITYEFQSDEKEDYLYISHIITRETSLSDARQAYTVDDVLQDWFKEKDTEIIEKKDFFRYGDNNKFCIVNYEGEPAGNYFTFRKGVYIYSLLIYGLYFDDHETWEDFIKPHLDSFEHYLQTQK